MVCRGQGGCVVCSVYRRLPPVTGDNAAAAVVCGAVRGGAGLGARSPAIGGTIARPDNVAAGADAGTSLRQPAPSSTMHRGHAPRPPLFWPGRTSRPPASQPPHTMLSAELYIAGNILQLEYFRRKILRSNEEYVLKPKPPVKMFMHNNCSFVNKLLDVEERHFFCMYPQFSLL